MFAQTLKFLILVIACLVVLNCGGSGGGGDGPESFSSAISRLEADISELRSEADLNGELYFWVLERTGFDFQCDETTGHYEKLLPITIRMTNQTSGEVKKAGYAVACRLSPVVFGFGGWVLEHGFRYFWAPMERGENSLLFETFVSDVKVGEDRYRITVGEPSNSIVGLWEKENHGPSDQFLLADETDFLLYSNHQGCWRVEPFEYAKTSWSEFSARGRNSELSILVGETAKKLELSRDGSTSLMVRSKLPVDVISTLLPGCGNREVAIRLELAELPSVILQTIDENRAEIERLEYRVTFDLDKNGRDSLADARLVIDLVEVTSPNSTPRQPVLESELCMKASTLSPGPQSGDCDAILYLSSYPAFLEQDAIIARISERDWPLLQLLNMQSLMKIRADLFYPGPTESTWDVAEFDGPWNWTSEQHSDELPGFGKYDPIDLLNITGDAEGDQRGESLWVDILNVEVSIKANDR